MVPKINKVRLPVARPYVPKGVKGGSNWVGVPGARHIPPSSDPVFPHFTSIIADWMQAGVEMSEEYIVAAVKLATAQVDRARERAETEARQEAKLADARANVPPPGTYGDDPGGVVYYIRRSIYVKIGTTTRLRNRMRDLMPDEVLAVEPGSFRREGELHQRFAHLRLHPNCEYFLLDEELQAHIDAVLAEVGPPPGGLHQFNAFTSRP